MDIYMQDLLNYTVREITEMKTIALDFVNSQVDENAASKEEVEAHFNESIDARTQEFWEAFVTINADFQATTTKGESGEVEFEVLKKFMDANILFFSEGSEEHRKFITLYENFYRAIKNIDESDYIEDEIKENLDTSLIAMIDDIKLVNDLESIMQLRDAVSVFEDKNAMKLLLEAIEAREAELTS